MSEIKKELINTLPKKPGVYFLKDTNGEIIYIGKSCNIKKRISDHFRKKGLKSFQMVEKFYRERSLYPAHFLLSPDKEKKFKRIIYNKLASKQRQIIAKTKTVEYIITENDEQAFTLEGYLIWIIQPPINKAIWELPLLEITIGEEIPRVITHYHPGKADSFYFGPLKSQEIIDLAVDGFLRVIPICNALFEIDGNGKRWTPCLRYHMHRCNGPCKDMNNSQKLKEYREEINYFISELQNNGKGVLKELRIRMKKASKEKKFEKAALLRDRISAITEFFKQKALPTILIQYQEELYGIFGRESQSMRKIEQVLAQAYS
jgi:excinuclease ABC subunit C